MSFHNDPCDACGMDYGPFGMFICPECMKSYCNACNSTGHDCEVQDDE